TLFLPIREKLSATGREFNEKEGPSSGFFVERAQRQLGRALLGLLLGLADAARALAIADSGGDLEGLVVVGPALGHDGVAHRNAAARRALLQPRLEIRRAG